MKKAKTKKTKKKDLDGVRIQCRLDAAMYRKAKVLLANAGVSWQTLIETQVRSLVEKAQPKKSNP